MSIGLRKNQKQTSLLNFFGKNPPSSVSGKGNAVSTTIHGTDQKFNNSFVTEEDGILKLANNGNNEPHRKIPKLIVDLEGPKTESFKLSPEQENLKRKKHRRITIDSDSEHGNNESESDHPEDMEDISAIKAKFGVKGKKRRASFLRSPDDSADTSTFYAGSETSSTPVNRQKQRKLRGVSEMTKSFLSSFQADDSAGYSHFNMEDSVSSAVVSAVESCYEHSKLDFLKPDNIRDEKGRKPSDPEYDPGTLYVPESYLKKVTPGLKQWWEMKAKHFDTVLFFKVGKFYEMYHMDAVTCVRELSLSYMKGAFAHCGFPEVAYGRFADQLVQRGYKVARVEQTETPLQLEERKKKAASQFKPKVVSREICRITTPGTQTFSYMDAGNDAVNSDVTGETVFGSDCQAKYLLAICERLLRQEVSTYGICFVDTGSGKFQVGQFEDDFQRSKLRTLIAHYPPIQVLFERGRISSQTFAVFRSCLAGQVMKEALIPSTQFWSAERTLKEISGHPEYFRTAASDEVLVQSEDWPESLLNLVDETDPTRLTPAENWKLALMSLGAVTWYLRNCLIDVDLISMKQFSLYEVNSLEDGNGHSRRIVLDGISLKNLNVIPGDQVGVGVEGTLFDTVDFCNTPFGKRLLRQWMCAPLCNVSEIRKRQIAVKELGSLNVEFIETAKEKLKKIPDLERLLQRSELLHQCLGDGSFPDINTSLKVIEASFDAERAKKEGLMVPEPGFVPSYDNAVERVNALKNSLDNYLKMQRKKFSSSNINYTGSGRNRYQLEVPDSVSKNITSEYEVVSQRKGFKRYMTQEIECLFQQLQSAEEECELALKDNMRSIFELFDKRYIEWKLVTECIAVFDVLLSFHSYGSRLSGEVNFCMPEFEVVGDVSPYIVIEEGFHPCFAHLLSPGTFIPNSVEIGSPNFIMLLTGPNMGGKSTLMRQVSLLVILAQMGSFVPAGRCRLTPVDRIFTRLGANDRLLAGQSTFCVELSETNVLLKDATSDSLVILDELGRGTSTHDGTAIAYAVLKDLAQRIRCRTMFSTHYHSLVEDFRSNSAVQLQHMACMVENENEDDPTDETVTFLFKLKPGPCPKSYGFHVAKLAGIPLEVIRRGHVKSKEIDRDKSQKLGPVAQLTELAGNVDSLSDQDLLQSVKNLLLLSS